MFQRLTVQNVMSKTMFKRQTIQMLWVKTCLKFKEYKCCE